MTDERFVQITAELLQSNRRYHWKMQEIMAAVNSRHTITEGSCDGPAPSSGKSNGYWRASLVGDESSELNGRRWD
jgi:hypothetical protein